MPSAKSTRCPLTYIIISTICITCLPRSLEEIPDIQPLRIHYLHHMSIAIAPSERQSLSTASRNHPRSTQRSRECRAELFQHPCPGCGTACWRWRRFIRHRRAPVSSKSSRWIDTKTLNKIFRDWMQLMVIHIDSGIALHWYYLNFHTHDILICSHLRCIDTLLQDGMRLGLCKGRRLGITDTTLYPLLVYRIDRSWILDGQLLVVSWVPSRSKGSVVPASCKSSSWVTCMILFKLDYRNGTLQTCTVASTSIMPIPKHSFWGIASFAGFRPHRRMPTTETFYLANSLVYPRQPQMLVHLCRTSFSDLLQAR